MSEEMDSNSDDINNVSNNSISLGTDLRLQDSPLGADLARNEQVDIATVSGELNLVQAILHRLRTVKGELSDLGHPDYGSALSDLIGEPNNARTRDRLRLIIKKTLLQESRIREILLIDIRPDLSYSETVNVEITVLPVNSRSSLEIAFPFSFEEIL